MENSLKNLSEGRETQQETQEASQNIKDGHKANFCGRARYIEVDHTKDDVSTMQDIELPSEEILEDKTVGFSTIEFSTIYENYLHGIDMHNTRKSSSEEDKNLNQEILSLPTFLTENLRWKNALLQ
jgi:hypothetical protein